MPQSTPTVLAGSSSASAGAARAPVFAPAPEAVAASQLTAFTAALEACTGRTFPTYEALHEFSVREHREFWRFFVLWSRQQLDWDGSVDPVCVGDDCEHARFFPNLRLNYAGNLLNSRVAPLDAPALTACHADGGRVRWTRGELRERVARLALGLSTLGVREGDQVVAVLRNDEQAVVAALATAALGATLSTASPEMGVAAMLGRFAPLAPRLLFAHTLARAFDTGMPLRDRIAALAAGLPSLESIVALDGERQPVKFETPVYPVHELIDRADAAQFEWRRFPFNHPLFVMFSSGTTGKPKCIVHGAGGSLLEHVKEHRLHTDLRPGDRMYFHTSCAWMMWNWQLSALASGVEIVTYDGPVAAVETLWRLVAGERVTVFGTSPAYLRMCEEADLTPGRFDLGALRGMLSTGAVLYDRQFEWVREKVKPLPLQSISGGTDILGCFVLGNPNLPVFAGEAQCKSLGLDVQAWSGGRRTGGAGELVCVNPFPSRPLGFHDDADGAAFHAAYFKQNAGCWTHGDLIEFSAQGTARLHGRCDGVLNVGGIKVAPGEIYAALQGLPEVRQAAVVEQQLRGADATAPAREGEQRLVLLLVLRPDAALDSALVTRVRRELARRLSPAHVPDLVVAVDDLPVTHSGKLSEAAVRDAVNGVAAGNAVALRNPECLPAIGAHAALRAPVDVLPVSAAPRERLEQHLQAVWQQQFGFEPIGLDDDFFDLGGNSLLAARLLAQVRRLTGRALPLAAMLAAPTIRALAAAVEAGVAPPAAPALVPMRAGSGAPLFLVHGLSGSVMECRAFVAAMRDPRPVYGLQARGLEDGASPQHRIEDIAAGYIEQIRSVQPAGPYALAGYSFGGLVALEMAQQLQAVGQRTQFLCLLDSYVVQDVPWTAWARHWAARARQKIAQLSAWELLLYAGSKCAAGLRAVAHGRTGAADDLAGMTPAWRDVYEKMCEAMAAYRPRPYDGGPTVHLRAAVADIGEYLDPMPLWRRLASGGLVEVQVPGGHYEMVGPNAHAVAAALDREWANSATHLAKTV